MPLVYKELDSLGEKSYEVIQGSYTQFQTTRQRIEIFTNPTWWRMVFLDNELQSTTRDEGIYHAALVEHCSTKGPVCILGGGEGATARDVLKGSSGDVVMVDWDVEFVTYMSKQETAWAQGAFSNPRLRLYFEDVFSWINSGDRDPKQKFATILIDLCDPPMFDEDSVEENDEWCRWIDLFQGVKGCLVGREEMESGVACVTMNVGQILPWNDQPFVCFTKRLRVVFPPSEYRIERSTAFVPSFGADWGFLSVYPREGDL